MIGPDGKVQIRSHKSNAGARYAGDLIDDGGGAKGGEAEGDIRNIAITRSGIVCEVLRRQDNRAEAGEQANGTKQMATNAARSTTLKVEQRGTGVAATISGMVNKGLKVSDRNSQAR